MKNIFWKQQKINKVSKIKKIPLEAKVKVENEYVLVCFEPQDGPQHLVSYTFLLYQMYNIYRSFLREAHTQSVCGWNLVYDFKTLVKLGPDFSVKGFRPLT